MKNKVLIFLGSQVDNSPLIVFRICFGFLVACEAFGAILTGWVHKIFIETSFTFTFIGFDWLQWFHGDLVLYYYAIMGILGFMMMLGWHYRWSSFLFFLMWTGTYLAQKTHYNNHYYLFILLSGAMCCIPAHRSYSLDVKQGRVMAKDQCARLCHWFFIIQVAIVYIYASINKMHLDWIEARPIGIWFQYKSHYWMIGDLLVKKWFQYLIAWGGIFYDASVVFLLLFKKTRKIGFVLTILFNLFNSAIFQIGIFPYMMIALTLFFFPPETIRKIFLKKKKDTEVVPARLSNPLATVIGIYFIIQLLLPIRHFFYPGNVMITKEGHRMSWRMMLTAPQTALTMIIEDKDTGERKDVERYQYMNSNQWNKMSGSPDMIWQFAQRLKNEYAKRQKNIAVYARSHIGVNGHPMKVMIDPEVDLASVPWKRWQHAEWIKTLKND